MNKREQRRMALEILRMAPSGVIYTMAEAMELAENGGPWNLSWYINGHPEVTPSGLRWMVVSEDSEEIPLSTRRLF